MVRFSYSFSFVPRERQPGNFMFYVTVNRWENERCVSSETVLSREVFNVEETDDFRKVPSFAVGMVDLAYSELAYNLANLTARYNSEVNARPSNTSTN